MERKPEHAAQEISERILRYLQNHPQASDTVEGITQWWIIHQRYIESYHMVEQVLEGLVQRGLVHCQKNRDGTIFYSRADGRQDENASN